jgi:ADP-ribose pyrophosphatase
VFSHLSDVLDHPLLNNLVKLLKRHTIYRGYHRLDQLTLSHRLFQGDWIKPIQREVLVRKDVVAVLLYDPNVSQLVFIEQFRAGAFVRCYDDEPLKSTGVSAWSFEIVAGDVEPYESFETVARRETTEETGLTVKSLIPISEYWVSPANHSGKVAVFLGHVDADQATGIHGLVAEGEDIRVHAIPVQTAYDYLAQGKILYAPAIIALQWFKLNETGIRTKWTVDTQIRD